ncbi:MAG TPA: hypothetical protein VKM72_20900 [Thermoanaerobaculia bacterium]|nr:hypothetical protein [Thermoanaerobaculia bacterium]
MDPQIRQTYNAAFTAEKYAELLRYLESKLGHGVDFRISETPIFLTEELTHEVVRAGWEIARIVTSPEYLAGAGRAIPPGLAVPNEDAHTTFLQVDFALVSDADGRIVPRLIELQGFPSLYAFQWLLEKAFRETFGISDELAPYFDGLDEESYVDVLREVIVDGSDPETVVLLEIEPEKQKTRADFTCTERLLGVPSVDLREVIERGGKLFYRREGRELPIHRIYNRVIFDELQRKGLPDDLFRKELDVTWVGHPNWYFKISKWSLPFLDSPWAPPARFLSDFLKDGAEPPEDLESYVLKPLYSFAGLGVEVAPTAERLRSIRDRENFILQRKVAYASCVQTPDVPAKAEIRMMFVWKDRLRLINNLVRMSKGPMMGVDFNKDKTWIGASLGYHPPV